MVQGFSVQYLLCVHLTQPLVITPPSPDTPLEPYAAFQPFESSLFTSVHTLYVLLLTGFMLSSKEWADRQNVTV